MTRALTVLGLLVLLLAVYGLMYASWARRRRRHPGAAVASVPAAGGSGGVGDVPGTSAVTGAVAAEGTYVSTVSAVSSFDRVTAGGLGARSRARMSVDGAAVTWERDGAPTVRVGADRVLGSGRSTGMAGKVTGRPLLVAVTWRGEDGAAYETGFLPRHRADADALLAALDRLIPPPSSPDLPSADAPATPSSTTTATATATTDGTT